MEACEGTALIGPDNVWFKSTEETKQGGELGNEGLEAAGRSGGVELGTVRWPNASKTGSGVDSDTVRYVAIREDGLANNVALQGDHLQQVMAEVR